MMPYLHIGKMTFESYTLFINLGTVLSLFGAAALLDKYCNKEKRRWIPVPVIIILMLIGEPVARILKNAFSGTIPGEATHFLGRVLLLILLYPLVVEKVFKDDKAKIQAMNVVAVFFSVQHFFNRLACLCNGCCGVSQRLVFEMMVMVGMGIWAYVSIRTGRNAGYLCAGCFAIAIFLSEFAAKEELRILKLTSVQYAAIILLAIAVWRHGRFLKKV